MIKTPFPPARRPAHSHPPSQHISSTRASACSAAVFGWAATGNQIRPHVRDAGAQACQARLVRQMRHVLHVRQHIWSYLLAPASTFPCKKKQYKVLAGPTNMTQYVAPKCSLYCSLQGEVLAGPTHMTNYVAPKCPLYCFLQGNVLAGPTNMTQDFAPMYFVLFFFKGKCSRGPHI